MTKRLSYTVGFKLKGGFGHFIHIFSKCFLKSFIALFYTLMHVVAIFQV